MACFVVPAAEAVVTTIVTKVVKSKEKKENTSSEKKVPFSHKLSWLNTMLWGGSALLAFEHVWHGEVVPWFPFLSAMADQADMMEMFHEMATVGVCMALLITFVWAGICIVADRIVSRAEDPVPEV